MSERRVAWFHCFAGIAGDMALASLLDAGADEGALRSQLATLPLDGWSLEVSTVLRAGISSTRVEVAVAEDGHARTLADVLAIVRAADLAPRALGRSVRAFELLAQVEGRVHGKPPAEVHFHELGGHDTIIDVVGTMVALEQLGVDDVAASAVATGTGTLRSGHGTIPHPAPAVLGLLAGAPVYGREVPVELTTPTGAAILAATGATYGPLPAMRLEATGYGAGARDIEGLPNCTQVVLGTRQCDGGGPTGSAAAPAGQPLVLLETNVDDATGEEIADAISALLAAKATDAWAASVLMKKGRPGYVVSALVELPLVPALRDVLLAHTGSFGVRANQVDRYATRRDVRHVSLGSDTVRVKVRPGQLKVEHDDAAAIARRDGVPWRQVARRAERAVDDDAGDDA